MELDLSRPILEKNDALAAEVDKVKEASSITAQSSRRTVQALHDQLAGRGVTILTDPFDGPFGRTFALRDPDEYAVTIHDAA